MQKNNHRKNDWYRPLAPQFTRIPNAMPLSRFASIEAVLDLLNQTQPGADARKAYLLFAQYHLIGAVRLGKLEHRLQNARLTLGKYRSQKTWQDAFRQYCAPEYAAYRAFTVTSDQNGVITAVPAADPIPYSAEQRALEWARFWAEPERTAAAPAYASQGRFQYFHDCLDPREADSVSVTLRTAPQNHFLPTAVSRPAREPISVSWEELKQSAAEMNRINKKDYCLDVMQANHLKACTGGTVSDASVLTIEPVTNVVGMVGSGKSTLIKVLSYWCHTHRKKVVIVVDTVADVVNLWQDLHRLHVSCSPLIGSGARMKYINQVAHPGQTCLPPELSRYFTPACLIDGMDSTHESALTFGKEPCSSLEKDGVRHLCPYFDRCPATRMLRECYDASVVVTTTAGFASVRVGANRELFLDLAMREFDLVIFDECDRVQKTLDQFFMPETGFNNYIKESSGECARFMQQSSLQRESNPALQKYDELQRKSVIILSCIVKALGREMGSWNRICWGDSFSALVLLDDLYHKKTPYQIPVSVYDSLYALMAPDWREQEAAQIWGYALQTAGAFLDSDLFEQLYQDGVQKLGSRFPRPEDETERRIQDHRIQLILLLIRFDQFMDELRSAYDDSHETSYGQNELFGFLQSRFRGQQLLLPSALCGNLFGLRELKDADLSLFRQFAYGRSLMKDLPWLRTDTDGNPAGPHVMLLSGSSWAEGSYEYHVNRPVSYILESAPEKRAFLARTGFHKSGFRERVSGAPPENRAEMLRAVANRSAEFIADAVKRSTGKVLIIVNSYDQAQQVQKDLRTALAREGCGAGICRLISDAVQGCDDSGTIRRGEVGSFAGRPEQILIAPAMAIERGYNIVDETGHSALGAVFFLVRPMAVPDDIQQAVCKLNGYIEAHCRRDPSETVFAYHQRIRQLASTRWRQTIGRRAFGLNELEPHEKKDIVATLFILILQIFGRMARVTDPSKPAPEVYFMDGAFQANPEKPGDFDCLQELGVYLETLMNSPEQAQIARTLYGPFFEAYKKGGMYHV